MNNISMFYQPTTWVLLDHYTDFNSGTEKYWKIWRTKLNLFYLGFIYNNLWGVVNVYEHIFRFGFILGLVSEAI